MCCHCESDACTDHGRAGIDSEFSHARFFRVVHATPKGTGASEGEHRVARVRPPWNTAPTSCKARLNRRASERER